MVYTVDWFGSHGEIWTTQIFKKLNFMPQNILEIGSYEGKSTDWMLKNTSAHVTCVDTWEGSDEHSLEQKNGLFDRFSENIIEPYKNRVTIHRGFSGEVLRTFPCKQVYDFIYIDGSHYAKDVHEDAVLAWRFLKKDGVIVFDDLFWKAGELLDPYDLKNPRLGIEAFVKLYESDIQIVGCWDQLAIQRII
jgi:predicted O-methyltransferase YrrM